MWVRWGRRERTGDVRKSTRIFLGGFLDFFFFPHLLTVFSGFPGNRPSFFGKAFPSSKKGSWWKLVADWKEWGGAEYSNKGKKKELNWTVSFHSALLLPTPCSKRTRGWTGLLRNKESKAKDDFKNCIMKAGKHWVSLPVPNQQSVRQECVDVIV